MTSDPHSSLRLLREAQALAKLQHSNVVTVYEAGTVGAQVWVAMEFIRGCTLHTWLRSERRSWTEVLDVMLAAGQRAGMDFGLVRLQAGDLPVDTSLPVLDAELSAAGVLVGTPRDMAPEQYRLREADARSDRLDAGAVHGSAYRPTLAASLRVEVKIGCLRCRRSGSSTRGRPVLRLGPADLATGFICCR